jgi:hypothetical protein
MPPGEPGRPAGQTDLPFDLATCYLNVASALDGSSTAIEACLNCSSVGTIDAVTVTVAAKATAAESTAKATAVVAVPQRFAAGGWQSFT